MKIPHRVTFGGQYLTVVEEGSLIIDALYAVQITAMILSSLTQSAVKEGLLAVPDLCTPEQSANLSCPSSRAAYNAAIIW